MRLDPMNADQRTKLSIGCNVGNSFDCSRDLPAEAKRRLRLMRLIGWMKPGLQAIAIIILAAALATGALICPLWMNSNSHADMPCSNHDEAPQRCPISICQASSPYLIDGVIADVLPSQTPLAEAVDSASLSISSRTLRCDQCDDGSPPGMTGRLFLRTGALLI
jgi:hypothetical protein